MKVYGHTETHNTCELKSLTFLKYRLIKVNETQEIIFSMTHGMLRHTEVVGHNQGHRASYSSAETRK